MFVEDIEEPDLRRRVALALVNRVGYLPPDVDEISVLAEVGVVPGHRYAVATALPGARMLMVCSPGNPTGAVITGEDLAQLARSPRARGERIPAARGDEREPRGDGELDDRFVAPHREGRPQRCAKRAVHDGLAALVAVRERRVEGALAAIGHGDDGCLGVGSRFPDTGGETPGRFSRAEGTLELVRCVHDAHRIPEPCGIHPHPLSKT
jgi:hypothetical protein